MKFFKRKKKSKQHFFQLTETSADLLGNGLKGVKAGTVVTIDAIDCVICFKIRENEKK